MKVVEEGGKGVSEGTKLDLTKMDLPVKGTDGLLIVFWKEKWLTCRQEAPAIKRVFERFQSHGFEVAYVGAIETPDACLKWKEEFDLPFPEYDE